MKWILIFMSTISLPTTVLSGKQIQTTTIEQNSNASHFGDRVNHYEKGRKVYPEEVYAIAAQYINQDEPVLDIGCGTGLSTIPLLKKFPNTRGCDWDKKMLAFAEEKAQGHFDDASVYSLPYEQGTVKLATAFAAFHWFCDDAAAKEISRVLKPSGYFLIVNATERSPESIFTEPKKILNEILSVKAKKDNYFPVEVLERNGFEIVENRDVTFKQPYTVEEAIEFMQSRGGWTSIIEAGKEKEAINALRTHFNSKADFQGNLYETTTGIILAKKKA